MFPDGRLIKTNINKKYIDLAKRINTNKTGKDSIHEAISINDKNEIENKLNNQKNKILGKVNSKYNFLYLNHECKICYLDENFQEKFENQEEELHTKLKQDCEMILLSDNL